MPSKREREEELSSASDYSSDFSDSSAEDASQDEETVQEKRVRLAKEYIARMKDSMAGEDDIDAEQIDKELIASRIKREILEEEGKLNREIADSFRSWQPVDVKCFKGHDKTVTCAVMTPNEKFIYSASKDGTIIKFDMKTQSKLIKFRRQPKKQDPVLGHYDQILCLAVSSDSKYLATGGKDKRICIWSVDEDKLLRVFTQHRDEVTGLAFQRGKNMLYSCSADRTLKVFSLDEMTYVETLFGHQSSITCVANMGSYDRCLSSGGRDRSVRMWKIVEESQLVFRASGGRVTKDGDIDNTGSVDSVSFLNEHHWISGTDGGTLSLWSAQRKKPILSVLNAHGRYYKQVTEEGSEVVSSPFWITALDSLPYSDILATGSHDGYVRLWKVTESAMEEVNKIPVRGFVNSVVFSKNGKFLTIGVGKEHKAGRWAVDKGAKNCTMVVQLIQ
ncbi:hypothetical protein MP638_002800 [Amoeboaphelidium occidentale]|nr:hypothetical protein MP638_002800 [Amoeboaphelidium occidentale]